MDIKTLIARAQATTGDDPRLDSQIWRFFDPEGVWEDMGTANGGNGPQWFRQDPEDTCAYEMAPRYTSVINDAMTLVPRGEEWTITAKADGTFSARGPRSEATHSTHAGAILVAVLKSHIEGGDRLATLRKTIDEFHKHVPKGPWRMVEDDTGGEFSGWPSIWSDEADMTLLHTQGFKQEYWGDLSMRDAVAVASFIAELANSWPDISRALVEKGS